MISRRSKTFCAALMLSALVLLVAAGCNKQGETFVAVLDAAPATLDPLRGTDAASERLRQLMFNTLVRKNEKFEYVGELATSIQTAPDGLSTTFTLRDGVTFHDGKPLTSADAKYTLEALFASNSAKAAPFMEADAQGGQQNYVSSIETPDPRTLVVRLRKPWLQLLTNLVPVAIIPQGSGDAQKDKPLGSGGFRFVSFDESQQVVDMEAYDNYWGGAPQIKKLRVRAILDANTLQAELRSGRVNLAHVANLSPDAYKSLEQDANLQIKKFPGANLVYIGFNADSDPLKDARVRQAIAYAINRESIIRDLQLGQARIAHSILPEESWAFHAGQKYAYDPAQAKRLLDEAGLRDPDGDGPQMRLPKPIVFKITSASAAVRQYAQVIQNSLKDVGVPIEIETLETVSLFAQLRNGQFQLTTARWVGGNQDPIFLRNLFHSSEIPTQQRSGFNRGRYRNAELDKLLDEAVNTPPDAERDRAKNLYTQAQDIITRELPMMPLWYPDNLVVATKGVGNIQLDASADWDFVRKLTIEK
ncbi:MAG TPA: ABC transporter substrate-binding protein [Pyrinomonadaceae bacterium]|nr:ABC transporter substrate-binding protein [Pyrinomonadaceae bacterium]